MKIVVCKNNEHWSRFTAFYIANRDRIIPGYTVKSALVDVKHSVRNGRGAILIGSSEQIIGIGSFVLGLEEQRFNQKEIAVLGNSYFVEEQRGNRTFVRGLQVLAEQIRGMNPDVAEVRIPTSADNAYTNRLYSKFANIAASRHTPYGSLNIYTTPFDAFANFCSRFCSGRTENAPYEETPPE